MRLSNHEYNQAFEDKIHGSNMNISMQPIGNISTPYKEKFGIPRQPGLVKSAEGKIISIEAVNYTKYLRVIET